MKNKKTKYFACLLSASILASPIGQAFASQCNIGMNKDDIKINSITQSSTKVTNQSILNNIEIKDEGDKRIVTITDSKTGEKNQLIANFNDNTLYSTITKKTIDLPADLSFYRVETTYETKRLTYKQISDSLGDKIDVASLVGLVMSYVPGLEGAGSVTVVISEIARYYNNHLANKSTEHGLIFKIKKERHIRHRGSNKNVAYRTSKTIVGVTKF